MTLSYFLLFAVLATTMYYVQQQGVSTELRSRATSAVSCDYTIDIVPVSPTPTSLPAATPIAEVSPTATTTVTPEATPTIPDVVCERRASLAIVIDRSGSMSQTESGGKTKLELAKDAARAFVTAIKESGSRNIAVSIVSFGGQGNDGTGIKPREYDSTLHISTSSDYDAVITAIQGIRTKSGSCIECGIRIGNGQIAGSSDTKALILLTDGKANHLWGGGTSNAKQAAIAQADDGKSKGIAYYVIGFGDKSKGQIDEGTLTAIAGSSGQYAYKPDAQTWMAGFFDLLPKFCTPATP